MMITQFTSEMINSINNFYLDNLGEIASSVLTPATVEVISGLILFGMIASFRGSKWVDEIMNNEGKFMLQVGLPTIIVSIALLRVAGVL
ncbi:hypothetical protein VPIG_00184 [Vibrio phage PWH3a-P1]|uniref:hypothetical protein n=1 Tax=Vibrio phage PWH3a-P1 TaxID=754058 RepID=UPI0002C05AFB|nr:hypothetical protein VPIG_00184 [Vibrio phage PWH3a-P1]AGH32040.1 hypothetical protein VPIG_00184 [Vibrio phage PWH3a-P1]